MKNSYIYKKMKMKIWLDLRFLWDDFYSKFISQLTKELTYKNTNNSFIIYSNKDLDWFNEKNTVVKNINIKNFSIKEQTHYLKILNNDKNNLVLFFNHYKPLFYKWSYFTFLFSLKEIYYNNFSNYFKKYSFLYLLEKNLNKSDKIICFDDNTTAELIEKFNISESKINIITWFFPQPKNIQKSNDININISTKYNIKNPFFIYSWWIGIEKNYEKLIFVFKKLKDNWKNIDLVFLWREISMDIQLRNIIIELDIQKNIHFLWEINNSEKTLLYKQTVGTIFPSFYESFPFSLSESIHFNSPIITSNIKNIKNIFGDLVSYFSPISVNNIYENLLLFINKKDLNINYENLNKKYTKENSVAELINIIK